MIPADGPAVVAGPDVGAGPGPGRLGRSVVVEAGRAVPPASADTPVVTVDEAALAAPAAVVATLHETWARRTPLVIERAGLLAEVLASDVVVTRRGEPAGVLP